MSFGIAGSIPAIPILLWVYAYCASLPLFDTNIRYKFTTLWHRYNMRSRSSSWNNKKELKSCPFSRGPSLMRNPGSRNSKYFWIVKSLFHKANDENVSKGLSKKNIVKGLELKQFNSSLLIQIYLIQFYF